MNTAQLTRMDSEAANGQASIMIVEDEAIVALDLKTQLEDLGYDVVGIAESGPEAIKIARGRRPALALMDIMLKGHQTGIDVAGIIGRDFGTPVVYLTSYSDSVTVKGAARTAPYGYLTKPFQIKELRAAIEVALYKSKMERDLRESERWFSSTLRCVLDGVVVTEADASVRFLNPAAEALTGWSLEAASGRPVDDVVSFEPAPNGGNAARRALREDRVIGVEYSQRLRARDGHAVAVDASAAPVNEASGRRLGAVMVLRDATDRLRHEARLRASEGRFRNVFDSAPLGMALVSLEGTFLQVNDSLCRFLGVEADWLRGRKWHDVTHPEDITHEEQRLHELAVTDGGVTQFEKRYRHRDGTEVIWALVSVSLLHEAEQPVGYLYQVHDLTEQKQAAARLAEAAAARLQSEVSERASQAKSEFLSRMSHEMRTPLHAVIGFAEILQTQGANAGEQTAVLAQHILNAGSHLLSLVTDVLDLQRVAQGRTDMTMTSVALDQNVDAVEEMLLPMAQRLGVRFERRLAPQLAAYADELRLRQVLLNLGSNAIKYNRNGGTVHWLTEPAPGGLIKIIVEDTGVGMTPDEIKRLFQPFDRLGRENMGVPGAGLGLVIARKMVEEMGGSLTVTSQPDIGTRMCVELSSAA